MTNALKVKKDNVWTDVGGSSGPAPYVRPSDWLTLPTLTVGQEKFVGLYAVYNDTSNYVAVKCQGAYTVDWGDGSAPQNINSNVQANHTYTYSDLSSDSNCSRGYRQAIVTITPQAGQHLTSVLLGQRNPAISTILLNWLDIKVVGSNITTFDPSAAGSVQLLLLEQFEYVGPSSITGVNFMFYNFYNLQSIIGTSWTASVVYFDFVFSGCRNLKTIPLLNTSAGTSFNNMFEACYALESIPLINMANALSVYYMFYSCAKLKEIPLFNTTKVTNFSYMFFGCYSLTTIPLIDTGAGTNFTNMFGSCTSLETIPLINTSNATNMTSMFSNCYKLKEIPLIDTSKNLLFVSMFYNANSLLNVPLLDTSSGLTFANMFNNCQSLQKIPAFNSSNVGSFSTIFTNCAYLRSVKFTPIRSSIDLTFSVILDSAALNEIYTNLSSSFNKLSTNAGSIETSATDWATNVVNCAVTRVNSPVNAGDGSYIARLTSTASGEATAAITSRMAVSPNAQYTFLAKNKAAPATNGKNTRISIRWYDAGGSPISTDTCVDVPASSSVLKTLIVTATSPSNAATASLILSWTASAGAQTMDWDCMGFYDGVATSWSVGVGSSPIITVTGCVGTSGDNPAIATAKGWTVTG